MYDTTVNEFKALLTQDRMNLGPDQYSPGSNCLHGETGQKRDLGLLWCLHGGKWRISVRFYICPVPCKGGLKRQFTCT